MTQNFMTQAPPAVEPQIVLPVGTARSGPRRDGVLWDGDIRRGAHGFSGAPGAIRGDRTDSRKFCLFLIFLLTIRFLYPILHLSTPEVRLGHSCSRLFRVSVRRAACWRNAASVPVGAVAVRPVRCAVPRSTVSPLRNANGVAPDLFRGAEPLGEAPSTSLRAGPGSPDRDPGKPDFRSPDRSPGQVAPSGAARKAGRLNRAPERPFKSQGFLSLFDAFCAQKNKVLDRRCLRKRCCARL